MSFFFNLLVTWLLNLIAGGFVIGLMMPSFEKSRASFPVRFVLPNSFGDFFEDAIFFAGEAGVVSCWLFIIILIVQVASVSRDKNYKKSIVITYWIGTLIYFSFIGWGWHGFPFFLFPFLFFGVLFFKLFLKVNLWSLKSDY